MPLMATAHAGSLGVDGSKSCRNGASFETFNCSPVIGKQMLMFLYLCLEVLSSFAFSDELKNKEKLLLPVLKITKKLKFLLKRVVQESEN